MMMLQTKNIYLRLINESDIDFLLSLRLNESLNKFLNKVSQEKEEQIKWLEDYKIRESFGTDYYFVIVDKNLGDLGFVRVYDIDYTKNTFTWGSWVLKEDRPKYAAIESFLLSYEFAFFQLDLNCAKFDARNKNHKAINFYERFGAKFLSEDEDNNYFELTKMNYIQLKYSQYYKFLIN